MPAITNWLNREKPPRQFPLSNFERICHELRPCDVILVEGRSRISNVIRWLTNSPWTHAALYIGRPVDIEDDEVRARLSEHHEGEQTDRLVIESLLGYGTIVRPLDVYTEEHLRICRPSRLSPVDARRVIQFAMGQVGLDYDVRQIFDLARFLLPWYVLPRKWASTLFRRNIGRKERTVCSTMIAESFGQVNFPILPLVKQDNAGEVSLYRRNPRLCTPSDFDYSPYFDIIKYPFMDFYHDEYHLLPWGKTGNLIGDEQDLYVDNSTETLETQEVMIMPESDHVQGEAFGADDATESNGLSSTAP